MSVDSTPIEDIRLFKQKRLDVKVKKFGKSVEKDDLKDVNPKIEEPEFHLK